MKKVLLAHPGTQHAFKLAEQLERKGLLNRFYTGFAVPNNIITRLVNKICAGSLNSRIINIKPQRLNVFPVEELKTIFMVKRRLNNDDLFFNRNKIFQVNLSKRITEEASVIIGYDSSSWILAEYAKSKGLKYILDLSTIHPIEKNRIFIYLSNTYKNWKLSLKIKSAEHIAIETSEYELADRIVVSSSFAKKSLSNHGVCVDKIIINPYGVDLSKFNFKSNISNPKVRFIFVGNATANKGIPLLLNVWKQLMHSKAELWIIGNAENLTESLVKEYKNLRVFGKVQHDNLPGLYSKCDVFVFPSYFEGFGLVLLEAIASGLPIISTDATAAPDIIQDGKEGFIIPSGERKELADAMQFFIDQPEKIPEMSMAARKRAEQFTWDAYGDRWANIINSI